MQDLGVGVWDLGMEPNPKSQILNPKRKQDEDPSAGL